MKETNSFLLSSYLGTPPPPRLPRSPSTQWTQLQLNSQSLTGWKSRLQQGCSTGPPVSIEAGRTVRQSYAIVYLIPPVRDYEFSYQTKRPEPPPESIRKKYRFCTSNFYGVRCLCRDTVLDCGVQRLQCISSATAQQIHCHPQHTLTPSNFRQLITNNPILIILVFC